MIVMMEPAEGRGMGQLRYQVVLLPTASLAGKAHTAASQARGWKQTASGQQRLQALQLQHRTRIVDELVQLVGKGAGDEGAQEHGDHLQRG